MQTNNRPFNSIQDLAPRGNLTPEDLQCLASANVFRHISGNRHDARWDAAAVEPTSLLLSAVSTNVHDHLLTLPPTPEKDLLKDFRSFGHILGPHVMEILRNEKPFNRRTKKSDLINLRYDGFARVAGIVVSKQRPGTAKGTMFMTIEDETGDINIAIWARRFEKR